MSLLYQQGIVLAKTKPWTAYEFTARKHRLFGYVQIHISGEWHRVVNWSDVVFFPRIKRQAEHLGTEAR